MHGMVHKFNPQVLLMEKVYRYMSVKSSLVGFLTKAAGYVKKVALEKFQVFYSAIYVLSGNL